MEKTIYDEFAEDVDELVGVNKSIRNQFTQHAKMMTPIQYAYEFSTVHVDAGRQTGKTTYMASRARGGDLIVVANQAFKKMFMQRYILSRGVEVMTSEEVDALDNPIVSAGRSKEFGKFKVIYVDEPKLVFDRIPQHRFYSLLVVPNFDQTIIMLGK